MRSKQADDKGNGQRATGNGTTPVPEPEVDAIPPGKVRVFLLPDADRDEYFDEQTHLAITKTPAVVDRERVGKNSRLQLDVVIEED